MSEPAPRTFHVRREQTGRTLADALRGWLPDHSWSQVQRLVKTRHVMVDGNLCLDIGRRLNGKEVVKLMPRAAAPVPRDDDVRIRYLDAHVVVVEKPAGMTSIRHPEERRWPARRKQLQPTLDEVLPRLIARQEARGGKARRGIPPPVRPVHRIDRDTSGLMIFARTIKAERNLGRQFRDHSMHRRYLAIAEGQVAARTYSSVLVRDRGDGRRGSTAGGSGAGGSGAGGSGAGGSRAGDEPGGKRAVTHVKPLEKLAGYTLVECRLETGRTHQIRIHLSEAGHPLCGDKVYRQPAGRPARPDRSGAPRLALHAAELAFAHPITGEQLQFAMPLPRDMEQLLTRLRSPS